MNNFKATVSEDCTLIDIEAAILAQYTSDINISKMVLTVTPNCCDEHAVELVVWDYGMTPLSYSNVTKVLILPYSDVFPNEARYLDGVYSFNFKFEKNDGSSAESTNCIFVDCETKCKVAAALSEGNKEAYKIHKALTFTSECDKCSCDKACLLFEQLMAELSGEASTDDNDCGCK